MPELARVAHTAGFGTVDVMAAQRILIPLVLLVSIASCSRAREYELRGQVLAVDKERQEITVRHEDIVGFMPSMTMAFRVEDRDELLARVPGELIRATLVVGEAQVHLRDVERTGEAPLAEAARPARTFDMLEPGEPVPDEPFVDQDGASRRLSDWRGKALAVTFIYTRCPLPEFCPAMDRNFKAVKEEALRDPALRDRIHLLSISFDPEFDRPKVLKGHADRAGADGAVWSFVTGDRDDIDRFASRFGVSVIREGQSAVDIVHNLRTAVIDPDGRLVRILGGNDWKPADLLRELRTALDGR